MPYRKLSDIVIADHPQTDWDVYCTWENTDEQMGGRGQRD